MARVPTLPWIDERVPDLGDLLPATIDVQAFAQWLAREIGNYRFWADDGAVRPTLAAELNAVRRARKVLRDAATAASSLPREAEALLGLEVYRRSSVIGHDDWRVIAQRVHNDAATLAIVLGYVERTLAARKPRRGAKPKAPRDYLLRAIVDRLGTDGLGKGQARTIAADVLLRCEVPTPTDERTVRRTDVRGRGQKIPK